MELTIDNLHSHVDIRSPESGAGTSAHAGFHDGVSIAEHRRAELLEALRPLVVQILEEELEKYARICG